MVPGWTGFESTLYTYTHVLMLLAHGNTFLISLAIGSHASNVLGNMGLALGKKHNWLKQ